MLDREPLARTTVVGGAGFIGSHVVDALLKDDATETVRVYDNFSSGREWHLADHESDPRLAVVRGEVEDRGRLEKTLQGTDVVIHLASNPDIARAATEPTIDFDQGTVLTQSVLEAAREAGVSLVLYASGSGVYGELGAKEADEAFGPLEPVSTYGASKLAGEALLASYCHMFGLRGAAFRFGNVVGPRQTHGVGFDFVKNLRKDPTSLRILGDGTQSKSYVHVSDVIDAVFTIARHGTKPYDVYNVATGDYITVSAIADLALQSLGLDRSSTTLNYTGGDRGWRGDVPVVRLSTAKIRSMGWSNRYTTAEALALALRSLVEDVDVGRI